MDLEDCATVGVGEVRVTVRLVEVASEDEDSEFDGASSVM